MIKSLRFFMLATLAMVFGGMNVNAATTVKWSAPNGTLSNITMDENVSLSFLEAGGDQAPKYSGNAVYFFNGNRVIVKGGTDITITKIAFTFTSEKTSLVTLNSSGKETTIGTYSNGTWTGEENSVTFRAPKQTGDRKISAVEVTYLMAGETIEYKADLIITEVSINATAKAESSQIGRAHV